MQILFLDYLHNGHILKWEFLHLGSILKVVDCLWEGFKFYVRCGDVCFWFCSWFHGKKIVWWGFVYAYCWYLVETLWYVCKWLLEQIYTLYYVPLEDRKLVQRIVLHEEVVDTFIWDPFPLGCYSERNLLLGGFVGHLPF